MRRYGHGAGAARGGAAARPQQLRDRSVPDAHQGSGPRNRYRRPREQLAQGDRRPYPRVFLPDRRWRDSRQRRPRLRAAPDRAPRDPPRLQARPQGRVLPQARARSRRGNGRGLSGTEGCAGARHRRSPPGRRALFRDDRARHVDPRRRACGAGQERLEDARRRTRVQAARYLRLPARSDGGRMPRARHDASTNPPSTTRWRASAIRRARPASSRSRQGLEYSGAKTTFHGYEKKSSTTPRSSRCMSKARRCRRSKAGQQAVVVLDHTPFYAESGGQAGDQGVLANASVRFAVARHAEGAGRCRRPSRLGGAGHAQGRRRREGRDRRDPPRPHRAQPLRDAPDAQGAARSARRPRAAERLARRCRQDALRLRAQRADDRRRRSAASRPS